MNTKKILSILLTAMLLLSWNASLAEAAEGTAVPVELDYAKR